MTELLILRGVPASGKSTYAETIRDTHVVVSRDSIRYSMFRRYAGVDEVVVTDVENAMVESALRAGENVVLDATNLNNKFLRAKMSLASRYGAEVRFHNFAVSLEEAMRNDGERHAAGRRHVGPTVLVKFFKRYRIDFDTGVLPRAPEPLPEFEPYYPNFSLPTAYIIDTDGTVADHEGVRNPYNTDLYHLDEPREHVINVVRALHDMDIDILGVSGRDEKFEDVTLSWWENQGLVWNEFFMRPRGDTRMDAIVKYEIFKEHIEPNYRVLGAFDDRPQVIRMWRTIGVPVFDVGNGVEF